MANARNRQRPQGRRPAFRDPKPTILVVSEGEVTEPEYLRGFQGACHNPRVTIEVAKEHGVPKTLVKIAKQYKEEAGNRAAQEKDENLAFDSVWCVFDIDTHPDIGEAKEMARDNGIDVAISNPCIELWLLLHFQENPGAQLGSKLKAMLIKHVPNYDKHVDYAMYATGYSLAVTRATRMDQVAEDANEPHRNPTTGVYKLTELIRGRDASDAA
jgi:hypothetical protein